MALQGVWGKDEGEQERGSDPRRAAFRFQRLYGIRRIHG